MSFVWKSAFAPNAEVVKYAMMIIIPLTLFMSLVVNEFKEVCDSCVVFVCKFCSVA